MSGRDVRELAAWLVEQRGQFTEERLVEQAREAGYTDEEIARAQQAGPMARSGARSRPLFWAVLLGYMGVMVGGVFLLTTTQLQGPFVLAGLVAGIVGFVAWRDSRPSLSSALGWGVLLLVVIPSVLFLVLLGLCAAGVIRATF